MEPYPLAILGRSVRSWESRPVCTVGRRHTYCAPHVITPCLSFLVGSPNDKSINALLMAITGTAQAPFHCLVPL